VVAHRLWIGSGLSLSVARLQVGRTSASAELPAAGARSQQAGVLRDSAHAQLVRCIRGLVCAAASSQSGRFEWTTTRRDERARRAGAGPRGAAVPGERIGSAVGGGPPVPPDLGAPSLDTPPVGMRNAAHPRRGFTSRWTAVKSTRKMAESARKGTTTSANPAPRSIIRRRAIWYQRKGKSPPICRTPSGMS